MLLGPEQLLLLLLLPELLLQARVRLLPVDGAAHAARGQLKGAAVVAGQGLEEMDE